MYMMLLMLLIGMMCRWNPKDISGRTILYPQKEGYLTSESHHWSSEVAMEAP